MNNTAIAELHDTLSLATPEAIAATLKRIETGRLEGRYYVAKKGSGTKKFAYNDVGWTYIPRYSIEMVRNDKTLYVFSETCGCLKGTIALESGCTPDDIEIRRCLQEMGIEQDSTSELELFVYGIHYGDTPETNERSAELRDAIVEWQAHNGYELNQTGENDNG